MWEASLDEYLCLTLLAQAGESETDFKARLSAFWTRMLRERRSEFEQVYAEATSCELQSGRLSRRYLIEAAAAGVLERELGVAGLEHLPIDPDDLYSKYEAAPPEWFWIEH